jgi:PKD domain
MKQILFTIFIFAAITATFGVSCKKENSCEGCNSINTGSINQPPVACAGNDKTITMPENIVQLDGSCSTDPDNNITGYLWTKIAGPSSFNINNANAVNTQVTNLAEGTFLFQLKVTDAAGFSSTDTVQIIVNKQATNQTIDIYISGYDNGMAAYWKNGQLISLSASSNSIARAVTVVGDDVYVAGEDGDLFSYGNNIAKYWKNGQEVLLTGPIGAGTYSIAVNSGDVYVAGWQIKGSKTVAVYWKNSQPVTLTDGSTDAEATSIIVVEGNVYVAGHENGIAKYWKNNQPVSLTDGTYQAYAHCIAVSGTDVYVAGSELNGTAHVAKYWKNGQAVSLTNGTAVSSSATSIAVVGTDVHVAGWEGDFLGRVGGTGSVGKYWKNGQVVSLTSGATYAYATSIAILGDDVYIAGHEGSTFLNPKYWKNGQAVSLPGTNGSLATGIFVVAR